MASFIETFAKKPLKYKAGVFAGIAVLGGLAYFQLGYRKQERELKAAKATKQSLVQRNNKLTADLKDYEDLRKESDQTEALIKENAKALPTSSELPAFFDMLGRKVGEAGVTVKQWNYKKEIPVETFFKAPLDVEITGTFYQIKRFFASLVQRDLGPQVKTDGSEVVQERERIITIENLELSDPVVKNREILMTAKFTASTFRQEEVVEEAKDPKKDPKAKDPKAKPGATTNPVNKAAAAGAAAKETSEAKKAEALGSAGAAAPKSGGGL